MTEADDRARLELVIGGLEHLVSPAGADGKPVSRARLFMLRNGSTDVDSKVMDKAARAKTWQKNYVDRMVDMQFLEKVSNGSSIAYRPANSKAIKGIILDWDDQHGELISKFVFPDGATTDDLNKFFLTHLRKLSMEQFALIKDSDDPKEKKRAKAFETLLDTHVEKREERLAEVEQSANEIFTQFTHNQTVMMETLAELKRLHMGTQQDLDALRNEVKRQTKASGEIVSSTQGALRALKEKTDILVQPVSNDNVDLAAWRAEMTTSLQAQEQKLISMATEVTRLTSYTQICETALGKLMQQVRSIDEGIKSADKNKMGTAIKTLEAAMELLTDAAAEVGK